MLIISIYSHIYTYICIYILVCTYRRLLDQGTHHLLTEHLVFFPSLLHSRFSQGDPWRARGTTGEGNSWFERLSNLRRAMACLPLLSSRERAIFALEHKAILGKRALSHPGRKQNDSREIWIKSLQSNVLSLTSKACLLFTQKAQTVQKYENFHAALSLSITTSLWGSFHFHFPNAPKWKNKLILWYLLIPWFSVFQVF